MKTIVLLFSVLSAFGQQPPAPQRGEAGRSALLKERPSEKVSTQTAKTITLTLNSEQATAIEKARVDALSCQVQQGGAVECKSVYPDTQSFAQVLWNNIVREVMKQYPPASVKAAEDAAAEAQRKADLEREKAVTGK